MANGKRSVVPFDPRRARERDADADAVILKAKKVKDWPLLEQAVDQKMEDQSAFVAWWRTTVTPNVGAGRGNKNQRRPGLILQSHAEAQSGITHQQVARWRQRLQDPESYKQRLYGAAWRMAMYGETVRGCSGDNEWHTPASVIDLVRDVLGSIDLDPASNADAQRIIRANRFYTIADSGLDRPWTGRVFCNPPYAAIIIAQFVAKLLAEYRAGRVTAAILLTNNSTDAVWFHEAMAVAEVVCFTLGRIKFEKPSGIVGAPPQGQAIFYFGNASERFISAFAELGTCLVTNAGRAGL